MVPPYTDYKKNINYANILDYSEDYFLKNTLIILYIEDSTYNNKYTLKECVKNNTMVEISLERISQGLSQVFSTVSYCIEIDSKNINNVKIMKIEND